MGQLLFCSHALAKKPYDIESASLNIYSLEEMSYYDPQCRICGDGLCRKDILRLGKNGRIKEEGVFACKLEEALEQGAFY